MLIDCARHTAPLKKGKQVLNFPEHLNSVRFMHKQSLSSYHNLRVIPLQLALREISFSSLPPHGREQQSDNATAEYQANY